ncbi:hypothetical protein F5144DRAFT_383308 [Chaetomium tenue]|uniref:Uncharacterized protein n=1 Tax=Chaetomium tenue TaxID=1854479 RepID=A0ACB7NWJ4_9PEZI|nr:hypothetical protein F5144DRAFT_383308 [Chaetomium globosum]
MEKKAGFGVLESQLPQAVNHLHAMGRTLHYAFPVPPFFHARTSASTRPLGVTQESASQRRRAQCTSKKQRLRVASCQELTPLVETNDEPGAAMTSPKWAPWRGFGEFSSQLEMACMQASLIRLNSDKPRSRAFGSHNLRGEPHGGSSDVTASVPCRSLSHAPPRINSTCRTGSIPDSTTSSSDLFKQPIYLVVSHTDRWGCASRCTVHHLSSNLDLGLGAILGFCCPTFSKQTTAPLGRKAFGKLRELFVGSKESCVTRFHSSSLIFYQF